MYAHHRNFISLFIFLTTHRIALVGDPAKWRNPTDLDVQTMILKSLGISHSKIRQEEVAFMRERVMREQGEDLLKKMQDL